MSLQHYPDATLLSDLPLPSRLVRALAAAEVLTVRDLRRIRPNPLRNRLRDAIDFAPDLLALRQVVPFERVLTPDDADE